jgi:signal transduction histidine kinase
VRLSVEKAEGFMVLRVSDQGRGIPAHLTQSIFDRFKQVQASDAKEKGGSGLGLAICKALVELHGGQIKVDSQVDQGSTFSFRIPHEEEAEVSITSSSVPYPKVTA